MCEELGWFELGVAMNRGCGTWLGWGCGGIDGVVQGVETSKIGLREACVCGGVNKFEPRFGGCKCWDGSDGFEFITS